MGSLEPVKILDCVGLYCPQPLFLTREAIDSINIGEILEVHADDPAAKEDIRRFCKRTGQEIVGMENEDGMIRFLIRRIK